jgi:hypothetical protein
MENVFISCARDITQHETRPWQQLIEGLREAAAARQVHTVPVPRGAPPVIQKAIAALDSLDPETTGNP